MENEKVLKGICCEVKNCVHNNGNCCCTADSIKVKNRMAVLGEETMCETCEELSNRFAKLPGAPCAGALFGVSTLQHSGGPCHAILFYHTFKAHGLVPQGGQALRRGQPRQRGKRMHGLEFVRWHGLPQGRQNS